MGGTARLTSMYEDLKEVARRTLTSMAHIDDSLEREVRTVCTVCTIHYCTILPIILTIILTIYPLYTPNELPQERVDAEFRTVNDWQGTPSSVLTRDVRNNNKRMREAYGAAQSR
jgi:hypothetical protein